MGVKFKLVVFLLIFVTISLKIHALKCIQNDINNDEMKKVVRTCMKRYESGANTNGGINENNNADDYDDNNSEDNEPFRVRNRDKLQMKTGRNKRSSYDRNRLQQNEKRYNTFNNNNNNNNNQRSYQNNTDQKSREHRYIRDDRACMVHCFFEELSMLNNDDLPDKHKVLHVITKDIRDLELKEFYIDSIQECFHFTELDQRKDKCQFAKALITCMADYAKSNCEDWHDHTMIFN